MKAYEIITIADDNSPFTTLSLLRDRLEQRKTMKTSNPSVDDPTPTLADIEKSHFLFLHSHFKPFVNVVSEYKKYDRCQLPSKFEDGKYSSFMFKMEGDFIGDMVLHARLGKVVAPSGTVSYVEAPGHRFLKSFYLQVSGNIIDSADEHVMDVYQKFFVSHDKQYGWKRATGQRIPHKGYDENGSYVKFTDGYQVPKKEQPPLDLWIPIPFDYCANLRNSLPSKCLPYGQIGLDMDFNKVDKILQFSDGISVIPEIEIFELYVNNIFIGPEFTDMYVKTIDKSVLRTYHTFISNSNHIELDKYHLPIEDIFVMTRPNDNDTVYGSANIKVTINDKLYCYPITDNSGIVRIPINIFGNENQVGGLLSKLEKVVIESETDVPSKLIVVTKKVNSVYIEGLGWYFR